MANINETLHQIMTKQNMLMDKLESIMSEITDTTESPLPRKRNPASDDIGGIKWIPVSQLFTVWASSPFSELQPPQNFGVQSIITLDSEYAVLTESQAQEIIDKTKVEDIVWQSEKTDCDNIARYFSSLVSVMFGINSVGVVDALDEGHSYCVFLLQDGDNIYLRGFEPQTDKWRDDVRPQKGWIHFT